MTPARTEEEAPQRGRCSTHPGSDAIAACERCGRPLCLECAVPVRGEVLGAECLPDVLEDPDSEQAARAPDAPPRRSNGDRIALTAAAVALLASAVPWYRTGPASVWLGGWPMAPYRHSSLVGPVALLGLLALWRATRPDRPAGVRTLGRLAAVIGAVLAVASALALANPPPFARANAVPFIAAISGLVLVASSVIAGRLTRPKPGA